MNSLGIFVFAFTMHHILAEIKLYQGFKEKVTFAGNDLILRVDNYHRSKVGVTICFQTQYDMESFGCPEGFFPIYFAVSEIQDTFNYQVNRQRNVNGVTLHFNTDGSLKLFVSALPKNVEVTLENAATVSSTVSNNKGSKWSNVTIVLIVGGVFLILLVLGGIGIAAYCLFRRNRTHTPVPTTIPEDQPQPIVASVARNVDAVPTNLHLVVPPKQDSATPVTKKTSTSTTKPSDEKVQAPPSVATKTTAETPLLHFVDRPVTQSVSVETTAPMSSTKTTRAPSSKNSTPKRTSNGKNVKTAKSKQSLKTARSMASSNVEKKPLTASASSLLAVEKTQSPTEGSPITLPTPQFGEDATAKELARNSAFKAREYVPRQEAPVPGSSKSRRVPRIIDEVAQYRFSTETYLCFGQRSKLLSGHDHMRIVDRIKVTVQHVPSDAERRLLKAAPKDAPMLADAVLKEAHDGLNRFAPNGDHKQITFDEDSRLWTYINAPSTPASVGYVVLYHLLPNLFKLDELSMFDAKVRVMPLCGLYTLLLDPKFAHDFRVELATELRNRASLVIARLQMDALRDACFPTSYLVRIYNKNCRSFVKCQEIHSKASK